LDEQNMDWQYVRIKYNREERVKTLRRFLVNVQLVTTLEPFKELNGLGCWQNSEPELGAINASKSMTMKASQMFI